MQHKVRKIKGEKESTFRNIMEGTMTSCTKPSIKDSEGPMARFHLIVDLKFKTRKT